MIKDIQQYNELVTPNSQFMDELKDKLPEFFTADKYDEEGTLVEKGTFDFDKFRLALKARNVDELSSGYQLDFIGKDYAKKQSGEKSTTVIVPDVDHNQLPENQNSHNLFLTGDNLDVLRHLQNNYINAVDMIYIDPPYNTGSDGFVYPDKFEYSDKNLRDMFGLSDSELERLKSIQGKATHSAWLTFMYPRLLLARRLLKESGAIFISIDDNESANLKLLCDDVFGESSFVASVIWQKKYTRSNDARWFSDNHEYIHVYAKNKESFAIFGQERDEAQLKSYQNKDNHPKGPWKSTPLHAKSGTNTSAYTFKNGVTWQPPRGTYRRFNDESMRAMDEANEIWFGENGEQIPQRKSFLAEVKSTVVPVTLWPYQEVGHNHEANNDLKALGLGGLFDNPKPVRLLERIITLCTENNQQQIVLDFFAGSGTTAQAVMRLNAQHQGNRKFILCTLDQQTNPRGEARRSGYQTIDAICRERVKRAADEIRARQPDTPLDLGFKHYRFVTPQQQTLDDLDSFDMASGQFLNTSGQIAAFSESGFDDMISPFSARGLGIAGSASGEETILTTWLVADGYKMDINVQPLDFAGYPASRVDDTRVYLIAGGWSTAQTRELLNRIGTHQLPVQTVVIYGYSFDLTSLHELEIGLKQLDQKVNLVKRY